MEGEKEVWKKWAENIIKKWHDEIKPDIVILTETSGFSFGYILKEAWKKAYPNEKIPCHWRCKREEQN